MTGLKMRNTAPYLLIVQHAPDVAISELNCIKGFFGDWAVAIGDDHTIDLPEESGEVIVTSLAIEQ